MFFKCKHPANQLWVQEKEKVEKMDDDFDKVTYRLRCSNCGKDDIEIRYARLNKTMKEWLGESV